MLPKNNKKVHKVGIVMKEFGPVNSIIFFCDLCGNFDQNPTGNQDTEIHHYLHLWQHLTKLSKTQKSLIYRKGRGRGGSLVWILSEIFFFSCVSNSMNWKFTHTHTYSRTQQLSENYALYGPVCSCIALQSLKWPHRTLFVCLCSTHATSTHILCLF